MPDRNVPVRALLGVIASGVSLVAAAILLMFENRVLQIVGAVILAGVVLFSIVSDWIGAWSNERHVDEHPHLLKNEAVGKTVRADGDFQVIDGAATGFVILNGEKWKACCSQDHVPEDGELMTVSSREGLTLYVQSRASDA